LQRGAPPPFDLKFIRKRLSHQTFKNGIEATDLQIDALVYELYGLTEEEIKIVESA
jgi:hypothetical protein